MQTFLNLKTLCILLLLSLTSNLSLSAQNTPFTGTWSSSFGNLMLVQNGNQVAGDYSTVGTIEGTYNPQTRQLTGTFDNRNAKRKGRIVFTLNTNATQFTGKWAWDNGNPLMNWNGSKTNSTKPILKIAQEPMIDYIQLQKGTWNYNQENEQPITLQTNKKNYKTPIYNLPKNTSNTETPSSNGKINTANAAYIPPKPKTKNTTVVTEEGDKINVKITMDKKKGADRENAQLNNSNAASPSPNCVTKNLQFDAQKTDLSAFMASTTIDWLLPGNLFYTESVLSGAYQTPNYVRKSIDLTASIYGNGLQNSFKVSAPKPSTINQTLNNFVAANALPHGAAVRKEEKQIHSKTDLSVAIFGKYDGKIDGVKAQLNVNFSQNKEKSYHLIDFTQALYEVAVDPIDASNHFSTTISNNEIANMAYISSVVYGRRAILVCETSMKKSDFNANFQAAYSNGIMAASGGIKAQFKKFFNETKLYILIYGGSESAALNAISVKPEDAAKGFRQYINTSFAKAGRSTAKPISYKFKFLADNSTASVNTVFNQPVTKCQPVKDEYDLKIKITEVNCLQSNDSDNRDDYRITVVADFKINGQKQNFSKIQFAGPHAQHHTNNSPRSKNRLMHFDEQHQLHVHESRDQQIGSYGIYRIKDINTDNNQIELAFRLWMCERSGDGCEGMVAKGGNTYAINMTEVIHLFTGLTTPSEYPQDTTRKDKSGNAMMKMGSGYSQMHADTSPVTANNKVLKLSSWMYARTNDYKRKARIHYDIELVKRSSTNP